MLIKSGLEQKLPYSLSRWTDLPATKWTWFEKCLQEQRFIGVDPRSGIPCLWSLKPEDTLGLIFWTRDSTNLVENKKLLDPYQLVIHFTLTGWHEEERAAPGIEKGLEILARTVDAFGPERVVWRFSPIPSVPDVLERFHKISSQAEKMGLKEVFVSFLQTNDQVKEYRPPNIQLALLGLLESRTSMKVSLCNETSLPYLGKAVCEDGTRFSKDPSSESCGCCLAVDAFTSNETCRFGCSYCLDPDTPVLFADYVWRPLKDVRKGDTLLGFDEYPTERHRGRKYRKSVVEGVFSLERPCLRLTLDNGTEVITSLDHKWLTGRSRKGWVSSRKLCLSHVLLSVGEVSPSFDFDEDFQAGYLTGMSLGDGTFRFPTDLKQQVYWRVALSDEEPLLRTQKFLSTFGVVVPIRHFDGGRLAKKPSQKLETRSRESLSIIQKLISLERDSLNYKRGFLSGFFDAEGSYSGKNLRIHQTRPNGLLQRCLRYAEDLKIPMGLEEKACRVLGTMQDKIRFCAETQPSLVRKTDSIIGKEIDVKPVGIRKIEYLGVRPVIDLKTSTATFMAAGLATHNCYSADASLAPKKRSTTNNLPLYKEPK